MTVMARVTRRFAVTPERLFDAWLDPTVAGVWILAPGGELVRTTVDPRVGGAFSFVVRRGDQVIDHTGDYQEIARPGRLVFTWSVPPEPRDASRVIIDIAPAEGGADLVLAHELHPDWAEFKPQAEAAWSKMLAAMAGALEGAPQIEIITLPPQQTVSIRTTTTHDGIKAAIDDVLPSVFRYLTSRGVQPGGPPFIRYHSMDAEVDLEGGLPVADAVEGSGRIEAGSLPGGETLSAWHFGPYDRLCETYDKLAAWMQAQHLSPREAPWEVYWTDPGEVRDPSQWKTQILYPVKR
ncbi:MAG TPA: SRPBCC domain-containing protein [Symbiobacteriaceae bacterium]|nr:SRPBCC domain-containing protein [Symbiobacteriaceae bacterium]